MADWRLLSNHGRVLVAIARAPESRMRDIAATLEITERTAHRIMSELANDGYLTRTREGSRNHYKIRPDIPINDPLLGNHWVGEILAVLAGTHSWPEQPRTRPDGGAERRRRGRRKEDT